MKEQGRIWLKYAIILLALGVSNRIFAQKVISEKGNYTYILWSENYDLTWNDFNIVDSIAGVRAAISWTLIKPIQTALFEDKILFTINTYFIRDSSIVERGHQTKKLLDHERIHWDIAELFARKLRKKYLDHLSKNLRSSFLYFNREYNLMLTEKAKLQSQFDKDIQKSNTIKKQKEWGMKVAKLLNEYSDYADTQVVVKRIYRTE